jgi:hypothetical protein
MGSEDDALLLLYRAIREGTLKFLITGGKKFMRMS